MACDPQTLVNNARCIECGIPQGMQMPVLIYLFCLALSDIDTGGGTNQVFQGNGVPVGVQAGMDGSKAALYTDLLTGIIYTWNYGTQTWL